MNALSFSRSPLAVEAYDLTARKMSLESFQGIEVTNYLLGHLGPVITRNGYEPATLADPLTAAALLWSCAEGAVIDCQDVRSARLLGEFFRASDITTDDIKVYQEGPVEDPRDKAKRYATGLLADAHFLRTTLEFHADRCVEQGRRFVHPSDTLRLARYGVNLESIAIGAARIAAVLRHSSATDREPELLIAESFYVPTTSIIGLDAMSADLSNLVLMHNGADSDSLSEAKRRLKDVTLQDLKTIAGMVTPALTDQPVQLNPLTEASVGYRAMVRGDVTGIDTTVKGRVKSEYSLAEKIAKKPEGSENISDDVGITIISPDMRTVRDQFTATLKLVNRPDSGISLKPSANKEHSVSIQGPKEWIDFHAQSLNALGIPFNVKVKPFKTLKFTAAVDLNGRTIPFEVQYTDEESYRDSRVGESSHLLMKAEKKGLELEGEARDKAVLDMHNLAARAENIGNEALNDAAIGNLGTLSSSVIWIDNQPVDLSQVAAAIQ